ncbi:BON domain-containing protein [bacterium]|nr:BON domain-containing protein [bacterium]
MRNATFFKKMLTVLALTASFSACAAISGRETAGEYADDTTITTKVKAAILDEPSLKSRQISVETMQNIVQLSGFVDSSQTKSKAGEVARSVHGVRSVKNDLIVR